VAGVGAALVLAVVDLVGNRRHDAAEQRQRDADRGDADSRGHAHP
jgi:hypothetical protein